MGKRGPAKTPTAILKKRKSRKAKARKNEPKPPARSTARRKTCTIPPPDSIKKNKRAVAIWKKVGLIAEAMGTLTVADDDAFARYCWIAARIETLYEIVDQTGGVQGPPGYQKPMPQVRELKGYLSEISRLESKFGLTASDRAGIKLPAPPATEGQDKETRGRKKKQDPNIISIGEIKIA